MTTIADRSENGGASKSGMPEAQAREVPSMMIVTRNPSNGSFLINNLSRIHRYPDIVHLKLGINDFYLATNPALIQEILVTKQRDFIKGEFLRNTRKVFRDGLLTSEGDFHHRQRRLIQPAFHHDRIKVYATIMTQYEERLTSSWQDGEVLDIHGEMTKLTMSIIAKCLFDRDIESESKTISEDFTKTIEYFNRLSSPLARILERLPSNKKYVKATERIDSLVYNLIKQRRESVQDTGDLMSMLLRARDEDGSTMTDSQVRDEILITFAAGHETTTNALTWTWYLLSENPTVEEKVHAEVDAMVPKDRAPEPEDVQKLGYTTKVLTESMRVYPPAWTLDREALKDCIIGGYSIPKGAGVLLSQYVTHHDLRFFPDPEKFDPDRWTPEIRSKLPKFAYFPFGGGARSCVGEPLAWMEGVLLLAAISGKWSMRHVRGHKVEMLPRITMRPKYGMMMKLKRR